MIKYNLAWVFSCLFVLALYSGWLMEKCSIAAPALGIADKSLRILWVGVAALPASIVWLIMTLVALPNHLEYYLIIVSFLPFFTSILMAVALCAIWITQRLWWPKKEAQ